ncbi:hypothetical protein AMJ47_03625 [Parcubacteria bacterium DG_72]|nr:MAG: hypothetical protein AMJ47_03625 [Parcubacteria bacterium DG_72]
MVKKILLLFLVFAGCFAFGSAKAQTYYYDNIEVDIFVKENSTFDVIERQTYYLDGSFGYFFRDVKLKDLDHISNVLVYDSDGNLLDKNNYDLSYKGNNLHIQWNFERRIFNKELKFWAIKYTVHGGLRFFKDHDELYWNAIFENREVNVENAKITVHLPEGIKKQEVEVWSYIGKPENSRTSYNYNVIDDKTVEFLEQNIEPGEFLTISVSWPKGIVKKPFLYRNQIIALITLLIALTIPIIVFVRAFKQWSKKGKDAKINKTIIAQYEPPAYAKATAGKPDNLVPAVVGVLVKQKIEIKEIIATVINLAVRGYLRIKEEEKGFLVFKHKEYTFEKLKDFNDLKPFERKILDALFKKGNTVSTSDLKNKFYKEIKDIKKEIYKQVATIDLFEENVEKTRNKYSIFYIITLVLGFVILFAGIMIINILGLAPILLTSAVIIGVSILISAIIGLLFSWQMPALTQAGAEAKWHALGFKEYLHTAERFRVGAETLKTFSLFLPYAMVFGVEKQWAKRFADFEYQPQTWYFPAAVYSGRGGAPANFSEFASGFSSFSSAVLSSFSPPGGSGAGGAGGAGGGGGGGGGGAG